MNVAAITNLVDDRNINQLIKTSPEYNKMLFMAYANELEYRLKEDVGLSYIPTPKQLLFHQSPCKIRMFIGGNRSGKTTGLIMETRWIVLDEHPYRDTSKMKTIWIVGLDKINMLAGTIIPRFLEAIPERYIESYDKKNYILNIKNKKKIIFKSCDSEVAKFQSADVDAVGFDEEPPQKIYVECMMRTIDRGGLIYIAETPTNGLSWAREEIYLKRDGKNIEVIEVDTDENPHIPKEEIDRAFSMLSPDEIDMRRHGKWVSLGAQRVFPERMTKPLKKYIREPVFKGDLYNGKTIEEDGGYLKLYEFPNAKEAYYIGFDTSEGVSDPSAGVIIKRSDKIRVVGTYLRKIDIEMIYHVVSDIGKFYPNNLLTLERNSNGSAVLSNIRYNYTGTIYTQEDTSEIGDVIGRKLGWRTTKPSKAKMIQDFKDLITSDQIEIPDAEIIAQMENYIQNPKGGLEASTGHDDLVMAIMLAIEGMMSLQADGFLPVDPTKYKGTSKAAASDRIKWHSF